MGRLEHVDVVILGAGIAGVGAACNLSRTFPGRTYAVLEMRDDLGGTWSLFRYPGIRADTDVFTMGYRFKPWLADQLLADGHLIQDYVREAAEEHGVTRKIRYRHKVVGAAWSSAEQRWTVEVETASGLTQLTCSFLWSCGGYYDYEGGFQPEFTGVERFEGVLVHPQFWPEGLDYTDKRVVVIGSGATAVTLVPAMAPTAQRVTMLQRSPSYVVSLPARDMLAVGLMKVLPDQLAYRISRSKNVRIQRFIFQFSQRRPALMRRYIRGMAARALPKSFDVDTHFNPRYDPWDERMCIVPNGDLFRAIREGKADVVTDTIETFTEHGIMLSSGEHLDADIVVSATGLTLKPLAGTTRLVVDGQRIDVPQAVAYKAMMLSGVPNFAFVMGYINASWTLKAELVSEYVLRLLAHLDEHGYASATPRADPDVETAQFLDFSPGYFRRGVHLMPRRGLEGPWKVEQDYRHDQKLIRHGEIDDGELLFK